MTVTNIKAKVIAFFILIVFSIVNDDAFITITLSGRVRVSGPCAFL